MIPALEKGTPGDGNRVARLGRVGFWMFLLLTWLVAVAYMWDALTSIPSAERLEESRMVTIPTPRTFFTAAVFSGMELAVVLAALWPWRPAYYGTRLAVTALAVVTWFVMTTPAGVSRMDWVHRRWLAFLVVAAAGALIVLLSYRLGRRLSRARSRAAP